MTPGEYLMSFGDQPIDPGPGKQALKTKVKTRSEAITERFERIMSGKGSFLVSALATATYRTPRAVTRTLDRLHAEGLVRRTQKQGVPFFAYEWEWIGKRCA